MYKIAISDLDRTLLGADHNWYANYTIPEQEAMAFDAGFDCVATDLA